MLRLPSSRHAFLVSLAVLSGGLLRANPYEVVVKGQVTFVQGTETDVTVGTPFTETFQFDTALAPAFTTPTYDYYEFVSGTNTFTAGNYSLSVVDTTLHYGDLVIFKDDPFFGSGYQMEGIQFAPGFEEITAYIWGGPPSLPITYNQPVAQLPLSDYGSEWGGVYFGSNDDQVIGNISSYSVVFGAPDGGSSAWLFALALMPLAAVRMRVARS